MGTCPICGKPLGRNKKACSRECYAKYRLQLKQCVVCGKYFFDPQSNETKTCSRECSHKYRQQLHEAGVYDGTLDKAREAAKTNPLTGPYETHMHAQTWVIQSPDGKIHECHNLKQWLREHADILDGTVKQAWDGISKIKYSLLGKRERKNYQWKGWRLLKWGEEKYVAAPKKRRGRGPKCVICGNAINKNKKTCSNECYRELCRRRKTGVGYRWTDETRQKRKGKPASEQAYRAMLQSPLCGPFETNKCAKIWTIQSPTGEVYHMRNLSLWLRNNEAILPGTAKQAWSGFNQARSSKRNEWKGWKILECK